MMGNYIPNGTKDKQGTMEVFYVKPRGISSGKPIAELIEGQKHEGYAKSMSLINGVPILAVDYVSAELVAEKNNGHANLLFKVGTEEEQRVVASIRLSEAQVTQLNEDITNQISKFQTQSYNRA